ncbi:MAG: hypothetical protein FJ316_00295 [SAR202 cluster bacterium]|nr:hypothetical protein [SAR202 cluster bacterium]
MRIKICHPVVVGATGWGPSPETPGRAARRRRHPRLLQALNPQSSACPRNGDAFITGGAAAKTANRQLSLRQLTQRLVALCRSASCLGIPVSLADRGGLKITEGRRVLELRPPLAINKGTVLRSLMAAHQLRGIIYLGDDITDMDAFYAVRSLRETEDVKTLGIGVVNAENRPDFLAVIDLKLHSVEEVEALLRWLVEQT